MIITMIVILCCLTIGFIVGRTWAREENKLKRLKEPKAVCGCKHHYALHDQDGGCHKMIQQGSKWVQCYCQHYTGPQPLPLMITGDE